jgi:tRNA/rRNA methyltransferase
MSFQVYVVRGADGGYHTGHTDDLERRLAEHQAGTVPGYATMERPIELMFTEAFPTCEEALARETQIRDLSRAQKEALFRGASADASASARSRPRVPAAIDIGSNLPEMGEAVRPEPLEGRREASVGNPPPAIVLVRPQLGQNIGKAARAMLNFGLTDMRLVAPRDGWPNPEAGPAASGADIVLAGARVYDSVGDAVADCSTVYATTVRKRGVTKPVLTPVEAAAAIHAAPGRAAILFGPERSGLETDDVAIARAILTVPINPKFGSLNLAQAVILVAYEWSRTETLAQPPAVALDPPAPQAELDGMIAQLDAMLVETGYFYPPDRATAVRRTLRTLLTKPGWTSQEVRTLRGVFSALAKPRPR